MIKLYEHPFSPYVQKVKISLYEKQVPFEAEIPNAFCGGETDYGKSNPRLEVPALIDDGFAIFDSTVILEYLEDKWPKPADASGLAARPRAGANDRGALRHLLRGYQLGPDGGPRVEAHHWRYGGRDD